MKLDVGSGLALWVIARGVARQAWETRVSSQTEQLLVAICTWIIVIALAVVAVRKLKRGNPVSANVIFCLFALPSLALIKSLSADYGEPEAWAVATGWAFGTASALTILVVNKWQNA